LFASPFQIRREAPHIAVLIGGASRRIFVEAGGDARAPRETGGVAAAICAASRRRLDAGWRPARPAKITNSFSEAVCNLLWERGAPAPLLTRAMTLLPLLRGWCPALPEGGSE
jgi:hypothetical protein